MGALWGGPCGVIYALGLQLDLPSWNSGQMFGLNWVYVVCSGSCGAGSCSSSCCTGWTDGCCAAGDALTKHVSPSRGKIMAAQLSVAMTFPFTILLLKVMAVSPLLFA